MEFKKIVFQSFFKNDIFFLQTIAFALTAKVATSQDAYIGNIPIRWIVLLEGKQGMYQDKYFPEHTAQTIHDLLKNA